MSACVATHTGPHGMQFINYLKPFVEHFPKLAATYRQLRDTWKAFEKPRATPMGFRFAGHKAMQQGTFEPQETRLFQSLMERIDVLINVGANVGYYCCLALHQGKRVVAFEPITSNVQYLLKNIAANNWQERTDVFPLALGKDVGVVNIYGAGTGASLVKGWAGIPNSYSSLIPVSTLDLVLGSRFQQERCLIVVDIEGAERWMLEGARSYVHRKPRPIWMMEIAITEHQPISGSINPNLLTTFDMFWDTGYDAWTANDACQEVTRSAITNIANGGEDRLRTRNFLFVDREQAPTIVAAHRERIRQLGIAV